MSKKAILLLPVFVLMLMAGGVEIHAQDQGTWLQLEGDEEAPAEELLEIGEADTLATTPRLGEGEHLDYGQPVPVDSLEEGGWGEFLDILFSRPQLEFRRTKLQDLLRENLLLDEENERSLEVFRVDSTLALSLYQLRGEEYPHYHPFSDLWVYIRRGFGKVVVDEEESEYSPGVVFQIPAGVTHSLHNLSGAPTVALIWQWPPVVDSLKVEFIPEDVLEALRLDSLRTQDLQERSLYKPR